MTEFLIQDLLVPIVLALLAALATWIGGPARVWVKAKAGAIENDVLSKILSVVGQAATTAAVSVSQEAVTHLKAAREDGKLTRDEAEAALRTAVARTWASIGKDARARLTAEAGSEAAAKARFLEPAVNEAVAATKGVATSAPTSGEAAKREVLLARARLGLQ